VASNGSANIDLPDEAKPFLDKLKELDAKAPKQGESVDKIAQYNFDRALILEKIVPLVKGTARDQWIRQIADCLNAAVQSDPKQKSAYDRLVQWQGVVDKESASSNTAAYVAYRVLSANYSRKLNETKTSEMGKLQEEWRDSLTKFVTTYNTAEDTPDALIQLGMLNEFMGKEVEAKNWYSRLVKNFDKHAMAPKAQGAIDRLSLEGKEFALTGQTLGAGNPFDIKTLKGKAVVVYYWASWNEQCVSDFAKIKTLISSQANRVELVCVNLDNTPQEALKFLQKHTVSGTHLYSQGANGAAGTDSPMATQYGIFVLPHVFVLDTEGKVVNRNGQVPTLDDDLKKIFKDKEDSKDSSKDKK
jgi:thiol-disulfide isomerase/thioredoxin